MAKNTADPQRAISRNLADASEAVASDPTLAPLFAERDAWFRGELADRVRRGIDDGSIRPGVDPDAIAVAVVGLLRGVGMQLISTAQTTPPDLLSEQVVTTIRIGLGQVE
jgi:BetI-type transcriptional repressor, C-terminal